MIVPTFNEERNIKRALDSVCGWAERVWVVDSLSVDHTVAICRARGDVCVAANRFENYGAQWNWALDNLPIETEWVMKLDADEVVTPELRKELEVGVAEAGPEVAGFAVWRKFTFMGKWLKHTSGKCYDVRVWRRGRGRFEPRSVNEHLVLEGRAQRLRSPLLHEDRKGIGAWVWRHNRYSTMEAGEYFQRMSHWDERLSDKGVALRRLVKNRVWPWVPCKPMVHFLYLAVFRLGFLDGKAGIEYAKLRYFYYYLIELKKKELRIMGRGAFTGGNV